MNIINLANKSELEILKLLDIKPKSFEGRFFKALEHIDEEDFHDMSMSERRKCTIENALHFTGFVEAIKSHPTFYLNTDIDIHLYLSNKNVEDLQTILERITGEDCTTKIYMHGITTMDSCSIVSALSFRTVVFPDLTDIDHTLLKISNLEVPELYDISNSSIIARELCAPNITMVTDSTIIVAEEDLKLGRNGYILNTFEVLDSNIISLATTVCRDAYYGNNNTILSLDHNAAGCNIKQAVPFTINYLDPTATTYAPWLKVKKPKKFIMAGNMLTEVVASRGNMYKVKQLHSDETLFLATDPELGLDYHETSLQGALDGLESKRQITLDTEEKKTAKVAELCATYKEFFTDKTATLDHTNLKALYHELTGSCDLGMENFIRTHMLNREYTCSEFIAMLELTKAYAYAEATPLLRRCLDKAKQENTK